jgi:hypothetical protein
MRALERDRRAVHAGQKGLTARGRSSRQRIELFGPMLFKTASAFVSASGKMETDLSDQAGKN